MADPMIFDNSGNGFQFNVGSGRTVLANVPQNLLHLLIRQRHMSSIQKKVVVPANFLNPYSS
jgi:hypothetical protein